MFYMFSMYAHGPDQAMTLLIYYMHRWLKTYTNCAVSVCVYLTNAPYRAHAKANESCARARLPLVRIMRRRKRGSANVTRRRTLSRTDNTICFRTTAFDDTNIPTTISKQPTQPFPSSPAAEAEAAAASAQRVLITFLICSIAQRRIDGIAEKTHTNTYTHRLNVNYVSCMISRSIAMRWNGAVQG